MTVLEAINLVDTLKPNHYSTERKVEWLNLLDGAIFRDVLMTHVRPQGSPDVFAPYDPNGDLSDTLIVPHPYCDVYRFWMESQIDLSNAEIAKYNVSSAMYNQMRQDYIAWYNRNNMPIRRVLAVRI